MEKEQNCNTCGNKLDEGASFCGSCGSPAQSPPEAEICPTCGHENQGGAQFCGICGSGIGTPGTPIVQTSPQVGFGEAISRGFKNYIKFSGRARRSEYWFWILFSSLVQLIPLIGPIMGLVTLVPTLSVTSRRLHDIGKTGWWQLWMFLMSVVVWMTAIVGLIFALFVASKEDGGVELLLALAAVSFIAGIGIIAWWVIWMVRKGEPGPNKYGADPMASS